MSTTWNPDARPNAVKLAVGRCLIDVMDHSTWIELGLLTDTSTIIENHPRLLRSLNFGDDDYGACVYGVVPRLLGEPEGVDSAPFPTWPANESTKHLAPLTLLERFPRLDVVSNRIQLREWVENHEPGWTAQLFLDDPGDTTLPDGTVLSSAEAAAVRLEVGEMGRQIDRIRRDHSQDPEAAIGQAKELIETVCKTILGMIGDSDEQLDVPALVKRTQKHLGIDPADIPGEPSDPEARAARRILGSVANIASAAAELRNARGSGHGRSGATPVDPTLARLTVGAVLPTVVYLVEIFEQRSQPGATPPVLDLPRVGRLDPALVVPGAVVRHDTFGVGRVVSTTGENEHLQAEVAFELSPSSKRLLVMYAPLALIASAP